LVLGSRTGSLIIHTALSVGAISIEADVWFFNNTLYVGHEPSSLSPNRTLDSLYIQPILDILNRQNPRSAFLNDQLLSLDPGAPIGKKCAAVGLMLISG